MDKRAGGFLVGAATGIALAWYFLRRDHSEVNLEIVLEPLAGGGARVATKPKDAQLVWKQKVLWNVTNNTGQDIDVSLEGWRDSHGNHISPAAHPDDPNQSGLGKTINHNDSGTIKGKARFGFFEKCYYDVYLDGTKGADPIIKLTP
jgi:hypothetical protein